MTEHLDETALIDIAEGVVSGSDHLTNCLECAGRVRELRQAILDVQRVELPMPSPLFWEQFPVRVSDAIDRSSPSQSQRFAILRPAWLAAAACIVIAVALTLVLRDRSSSSVLSPPAGPAPPALVAAVEEPSVDDQDEAWSVLSSLAEEIDVESAREAGVVASADGIEQATAELSDAERAELLRLIAIELKRTDS